MMRMVRITLLSIAICLLGITAALAYNEAPMLEALVAAGTLPSIEERLPEEPFVEVPFEEIGQYGGTLHALALDPSAFNDLQGVRVGLFEVSKDGAHAVPNIATGFKFSEDFKTLTIYLRKGLKWSDGHPFTADDILFVINDVFQNEELTPTLPLGLFPTGEPQKAEKVDEYTVNIKFPEPNPGFEVSLWGGRAMQASMPWPAGIFAPKHYLKRWHIKYNPKANELAKEEGYERWWQAYKYHAQLLPLQNDLDLPCMSIWLLKAKTGSVRVLERNPYFWEVDPAGNQLPYVDQVVCTVVDPEVAQLKIISGEIDFAQSPVSLDNYPLYKENEEKGDYRVVLIPGVNGSELSLQLNLNDPDLVLRRICQDIRFRRALSVAINRAEINDSIYFGKGVPRQDTWVPNWPGLDYKKEWAETYAQYDTGLANQLLDEMGLTKKDKDGFRLRPDGEPILLMIEYVDRRGAGAILELVKEYWEAVGIKVFLKAEGQDLFNTRMYSADHGVYTAATAAISGWVGPNMSNWWKWFETIRLGQEKGGEEPPEEFKEEAENYHKWTMISATSFGKEKSEAMTKLGDSQAKNLWGIGTVGMVPRLIVVKNNVGNVVDPEKESSYNILRQNMTHCAQLFFKK